jgi:ADP-heptose:LPS heptosyltransferase
MKTKWCCVVRPGAIGDDLMATSVLPLLARDYKIEVITQAPHHVIFENNPYVDKLVVKDPESLPKDPVAWQEWFVERGKEVDKLVDLTNSCETELAYFPIQKQFY